MDIKFGTFLTRDQTTSLITKEIPFEEKVSLFCIMSFIGVASKIPDTP